MRTMPRLSVLLARRNVDGDVPPFRPRSEREGPSRRQPSRRAHRRRRGVGPARRGGAVELGYALSSEEHRPLDLVRNAAQAEEAGFRFALVSDHFHPWIDRQGQSPFVWSVLGGIAGATERLEVGTGVTCPMIRIHPAIIAQAAATVASLMPGRFFLGLGSGENLNEHILGTAWPEWDVRAEMLDEAVEVIRKLWSGEVTSHRGRYYTVQNARIYSLPENLPPIYLAAGGQKAVRQAAR